jgi:DNA-binding MarR family transcriptional regulator
LGVLLGNRKNPASPLFKQPIIDKGFYRSSPMAVTLTEEGKKIVKKAIVVVEKFDAEFFSVLGGKTSEFNKNLLMLLGQK